MALTTKVHNLQRGMTIIELLVVIAIFSIVSTVVLFNYSSFSTNVSVRNLSQEIALAIRKAQSYATGVQSVAGGSSTAFPVYGVTFDIADPKNFTLFADITPSNKMYDNGGSCGSPTSGNECVEKFTINTSDSITSITSDSGTITSPVNILFRRPSPDAEICVVTGSSCSQQLSYVRVTVTSPKGVSRAVEVWNTGQISIK